jgi:hypothetical protein
MERQRRVKFSVEVRSGTARFRVGVQARSISEARMLVGGTYQHREVRGVSPVQLGGYFAKEPAAAAGMAA